MHQARAIRTGDKLGAGTHMILYLVLSHTSRDLRLLDGEHTAETAAFVHPPRLEHLDTFHQGRRSRNLEWYGILRSLGDERCNSRTPWQLLWILTLCGKTAGRIPVSPRRARTRRYHKSSCCSYKRDPASKIWGWFSFTKATQLAEGLPRSHSS